MSDDLSNVIATEKRKIAKILHDGLAEELTAATLFAKVLHDDLKRERHPKEGDATALLNALVRASASLQRIHTALGKSERPVDGYIESEPIRLFPVHE